MSIRVLCRIALFAIALVNLATGATPTGHRAGLTLASMGFKRPIPVILDTDIGDDIDDTWALGFLLKSPELKLKLAVGDFGRAEYRAKLLAKFLEMTGHGDIPVGMGIASGPEGEGGQASWVKDYDWRKYPGHVKPDGVQAMIDLIMKSKETLTIIGIGPMPNLAEALRREPRIAARANFVGMDGSVRLGYGGSKVPCPEWNIKADIKSAQFVLSAPWKSITITPLDTCGLVDLTSDRFQRLATSQDVVAKTVYENYQRWSNFSAESKVRSSVLYDTVAVYLAMQTELCTMEKLGIRVNDSGLTEIQPDARIMSVATGWKDLDRYRDLLTDRLTGKL